MNAAELCAARSEGHRPEAPDADLRWANLWGADLREANLRWADLREADLRLANLGGSTLREADLRWADLRWADLREANLRWANLRWANLWGANLWGANLWGVNLGGSTLRGAGIYSLGDTPSGEALIFPTYEGWTIQIGCWRGSPDDLRTLIAGTDWPGAKTAEERDQRRPHLEALLVRVDAIVADHPTLIADLAEKWGDQ